MADAHPTENEVAQPTFSSTFYDRNPVARQFKGRLVEMRSQEELLRNAFWVLRDVRRWRGMQLWTLVGAITGHGSGYSQQICEELGWDYAIKISPAARLPDRKTS
jgi:hypothetical protein